MIENPVAITNLAKPLSKSATFSYKIIVIQRAAILFSALLCAPSVITLSLSIVLHTVYQVFIWY